MGSGSINDEKLNSRLLRHGCPSMKRLGAARCWPPLFLYRLGRVDLQPALSRLCSTLSELLPSEISFVAFWIEPYQRSELRPCSVRLT